MSQDFRFKSFAISQQNSPMKVGTDGVLLGAWCKGGEADQILDVGTGTGLIAIMLAQRFNQARITAIEANAQACLDAKLNFHSCAWTNRLHLFEGSLSQFESPSKFDLIVSNPPFFHGALKAPQSGRNEARHADQLDFTALLNTSELLSPNGVLAGIYPIDIFEQMQAQATQHGMFLQRKCLVKPTPTKQAHRVLFEFGKQPKNSIDQETLLIEMGERHDFSPEYRALTKDFYLKF